MHACVCPVHVFHFISIFDFFIYTYIYIVYIYKYYNYQVCLSDIQEKEHDTSHIFLNMCLAVQCVGVLTSVNGGQHQHPSRYSKCLYKWMRWTLFHFSSVSFLLCFVGVFYFYVCPVRDSLFNFIYSYLDCRGFFFSRRVVCWNPWSFVGLLNFYVSVF